MGMQYKGDACERKFRAAVRGSAGVVCVVRSLLYATPQDLTRLVLLSEDVTPTHVVSGLL